MECDAEIDTRQHSPTAHTCTTREDMSDGTHEYAVEMMDGEEERNGEWE